MASSKSAEYNFYEWVTAWVKDGQNPDTVKSPDLVEIITILQILGFTIVHSDALNPAEMSCLQSGEKGLKINLSCCHSGVRFTLQGANECSCPSKMVENVQEIMSMDVQDEFQRRKQIEAYENLRILNVPEKEKIVIQTVLTHLVHMIYASSTKDPNENEVKENYENVLKGNETPMKRELAVDNYQTPCANNLLDLMKKTPEDDVFVDLSESRSKSLDNLSSQTKVTSLPDLAQLVKTEEAENKMIPVVTYSSPNLSISLDPVVNTSSPVANQAILKQGYTKLLSIQELVKDVVQIFEKSQEVPSFSFNISNIKALSESHVQMKAPQKFIFDENVATRTTVAKPLCRPPIRSVSVSSMKTKSTVGSSSSTITNTLTKLVPNSGKKSTDISPTFKSASKSQKFAHVKSTIPKVHVKKQ